MKKFTVATIMVTMLVVMFQAQAQTTQEGIITPDRDKQYDTWSEGEIVNIIKGTIRPGLGKGSVVEYFGDAHKKALVNEARVAGFSEIEAQALLDKALIEKKTLKGRGPEALTNFYLALDSKREELAKKNVEKKIVVDWNSAEAQQAIKCWFEKNMFGGKTLEQFVAKNEMSKTEAVALVPNINTTTTYVSKEDLENAKKDLIAGTAEAVLAKLENMFASKDTEQKASDALTKAGEAMDKARNAEASVQEVKRTAGDALALGQATANDRMQELASKDRSQFYKYAYKLATHGFSFNDVGLKLTDLEKKGWFNQDQSKKDFSEELVKGFSKVDQKITKEKSQKLAETLLAGLKE